MPVECLKLVPSEVLEFAASRGLEQHLQRTIDLALQILDPVADPEIQLEQDCETGDQWISLRFTAGGEIDAMLDRYDRMTDQWLRAIPQSAREHLRLSIQVQGPQG